MEFLISREGLNKLKKWFAKCVELQESMYIRYSMIGLPTIWHIVQNIKKKLLNSEIIMS